MAEVLARVRRWLADSGVRGIVLTRPDGVAWLTGGMNPPINRSAATDLVWAAVGPDRQALITTGIERDRVEEDSCPASFGFEMVAVPWFGGSSFAEAAVRFLDAPAGALATDGQQPFGISAGEAVVRLRLSHTAAAQDDLRRLGSDTVAALEHALRGWEPGEVDRSIQARLVSRLEMCGAEAVVVLVGGDARVERFRHPLAAGLPVERLVMAVVVARRGGLHVAATRLACAGRLDPALAGRLSLVRGVEAAVLEASRAGSTYGAATLALTEGYAAAGWPGAWREHYQGGPIGYQDREFELAPTETASPWWDCPVDVGHAIAWNPSLGLGAKVEDTFLVGPQGLECITPPADWPTDVGAPGQSMVRAAVLELA
ncbi:MAG: M24 family metallopeptidase [Candidatus Dormibacteria bacterium]